MLHYFAQSFFAAVFPVAFEEDDTLVIYAISDLSRDLKLRAVVGFRSQNNYLFIYLFSYFSPVFVCFQC